jgi:hypothetical protein
LGPEKMNMVCGWTNPKIRPPMTLQYKDRDKSSDSGFKNLWHKT